MTPRLCGPYPSAEVKAAYSEETADRTGTYYSFGMCYIIFFEQPNMCAGFQGRRHSIISLLTFDIFI